MRNGVQAKQRRTPLLINAKAQLATDFLPGPSSSLAELAAAALDVVERDLEHREQTALCVPKVFRRRHRNTHALNLGDALEDGVGVAGPLLVHAAEQDRGLGIEVRGVG